MNWLNWFFRVDIKMLQYTRSIVQWLDEWGLSQKTLEYILMLSTDILLMGLATHDLIYDKAVFSFCGCLLFVVVVYQDFKKPSAERTAYGRNGFMVGVRLAFLLQGVVCIGGLTLFAILFWVFNLGFTTWKDWYVAILIMLIPATLYVLALPRDGSKYGCKAKLAKERLVKLFGASWIPTSEPSNTGRLHA